jgi:HEAT repeat protein/PBS lyase HEAT-like repeat-containing protein
MLDNVFKERQEEGNSGLPPVPSGKTSPFSAALLVPLLLLLLVGLVIYLFGWISLDRRGAFDLVQETRASSGERRALTAFELSRLESYDLPPDQRVRFLQEVGNLLQGEAGGDPRVRRALAIVLGRMADRESVPVLIKAAEDSDPETQIYALWALGAIADPRALDTLVARLHDEDPAVRKTSAFALGELQDPRAVDPLRVALQDTTPDVRWNAAISLGRLGDEAALPALLPLLSPHLAGTVLSPAQQEELRINVIRALKGISTKEVQEALRGVSNSDPSARVRSEARLALEGRSPPPFRPALDLASPR